MTAREYDTLRNLTAIIFPHSFLREPLRNELLSLFGSLTICQPWYMESVADTKSGSPPVKIQRPPEDLKPQRSFMSLLSEYRLWMRQNRGQSSYFDVGTKEDTSWKIRQAVRQMGEDVYSPAQEDILKWHLILHLERDIEEDRSLAEEILFQVKTKKSPIEDALGEPTSPQTLFEDLHLSDSYSFIEERHLRQVMESWFGLFSASLSDTDILLTLDAQVMNYAAELFEDASIKSPKGFSEPFLSPAHQIQITRKRLPQILDDREALGDHVKAGLAGKTIILVGKWKD